MNFEFTSDQTALLDAVGKVLAHHAGTPALPQRLQYSPELAHDLREAGFFECMRIDELGPVAAAAMVIQLASSPLCAEVTASAFVAPLLGDDALAEGPCAIVWQGAEDLPTRFLPMARTVVRLGAEGVDVATLDPSQDQVGTIDSLFAYPMGSLRKPKALRWTAMPAVDIAALRSAWRVGIAAEIVGCLHAGLQSVLDHVRDRRQFGRPLGSFQVIQHRLAECATAIEGARWLALKAAQSRLELDALLATGQAQSISTRVCYDLHQFMGAMGLTLEHPLHRWTYRAKLLRAELGGAQRQFIAAAHLAWGERPREAALAQQQHSMETES